VGGRGRVPNPTSVAAAVRMVKFDGRFLDVKMFLVMGHACLCAACMLWRLYFYQL
jgi:hypothetical protein